MSNLRPVTFIDTWALTSFLFRNKDLFEKDTARQSMEGSAHHDTRNILLRGPANPTVDNWFDDVPQHNYPVMDKWSSLKAVLGKIQRAVDADVLGKALIVSLKPGGVVDWHTDDGEYFDKYLRFHLALVTNPFSLLYSGGEQRWVMQGELCWLNNRAKHSAVNMGSTPRIHLIVDVKKKDAV